MDIIRKTKGFCNRSPLETRMTCWFVQVACGPPLEDVASLSITCGWEAVKILCCHLGVNRPEVPDQCDLIIFSINMDLFTPNLFPKPIRGGLWCHKKVKLKQKIKYIERSSIHASYEDHISLWYSSQFPSFQEKEEMFMGKLVFKREINGNIHPYPTLLFLPTLRVSQQPYNWAFNSTGNN